MREEADGRKNGFTYVREEADGAREGVARGREPCDGGVVQGRQLQWKRNKRNREGDDPFLEGKKVTRLTLDCA